MTRKTGAGKFYKTVMSAELGLVLAFPARNTVNGTIVMAPGDINLTFKHYITEPIELRIENDYVVEIKGAGYQAELMRSYVSAFDADAYATSHIGFGMNPGGAFTFPFGRVKLTLAHHSSSAEAGRNPIYLGSPCGILVHADGRNLYHAGDTALFLDLQLIGRAGIDVALLPIGDNFTMGPDDALTALEFLRPKVAVPMHYNTWPPIAQDASAFATRAGQAGYPVRVLAPGESLTV